MSLGLAMLARNNEQDIPRVLAPFQHKIDQIAIVLGGQSSDNTSHVARQYADSVVEYDGPLDEFGGLLDFAHARQQSFDLLSTDYALVIDTDDDWSGVEYLAEVMRDVTDGCYDRVLFPQNLGENKALQARLFKRKAGRWESQIHEHFVFHTDPIRQLAINSMWIRQAKDRTGKLDSVRRNIRIAEYHLKTRFDLRIMYHVCREYILVEQYEKAVDFANAILNNLSLDTRGEITPDKLFYVYWNKGMALYCLDRIDEAIAAALMALKYGQNVGDGWTMLAELSYQLGVNDLVLFAADKALALGNPIDTVPTSHGNVSYVPYLLKARVLSVTNRKHEALAAVNLGLKLGGGDELNNLKFQLCNELKVIP